MALSPLRRKRVPHDRHPVEVPHRQQQRRRHDERVTPPSSDSGPHGKFVSRQRPPSMNRRRFFPSAPTLSIKVHGIMGRMGPGSRLTLTRTSASSDTKKVFFKRLVFFNRLLRTDKALHIKPSVIWRLAQKNGLLARQTLRQKFRACTQQADADRLQDKRASRLCWRGDARSGLHII